MTWLTFAIISLVAASLGRIAQALVAKKSKADALTLSMVFVGLSRLGLVMYAASLGPIVLTTARDNWWLILLNMVMFPVAHILMFKGLKYLDASLHAIVFSSWVLYTVTGSTVILGESISFVQSFGLGLILLGVVLAHSRGKESKNIRRGLFLTVIATMFYGFGGVVDKLFFDRTDLTNFFVFGSGPTALSLLIMYAVHQRLLKKSLLPKVTSIYWRFVFIGAGLLVLSDATYFLALQKLDNIAHLSAVNTFSTILTVLIGIIVLKETKHVRIKLVAGVVATIGFLLLI